MKVFKFGGASVSTIERIKKVGELLGSYKDEKILVVISAMGKTTNALEAVTNAFYAGDSSTALRLFDVIKEQHADLATQIIPFPVTQLTDFFTEIEWLLHDKPVKNYDYYYDQIVCAGELLSTAIVSYYLTGVGLQNSWVDIRDVVRTDNNFRDATIDWDVTTEKTEQNIKPLFKENNIVLTQGFIGATDENQSTTLGREGSDYTAALFANILNAESVTIWKDVQGVMNADPKQYEKAQWIPELNYREVIEMAYYGAQVIHPKTIKPLQNKGIPLYVKSFVNPAADGTLIHAKHILQLPPILVFKYKQVMMELRSKDFSFVSEGLSGALYQMFEKINLKPNLTQNGAIGFICVVDEHPEKVEQLAHEAGHLFHVQVERNLTLLTIRHYNAEIISELCKDRIIILQQQTRETIQFLMQE